MKATTIIAAAAATIVVLLALVGGYRAMIARRPPEITPLPAQYQAAHPSLLYGRITTEDGETFEGRLRWGVETGAQEEAAWGNYFNGLKRENPWLTHVPPAQRRTRDNSIEIFGIKLVEREESESIARSFMARFGDLLRVESRGRDVLVTMKSGAVVKLDLYSSSDFDDGVRVWDSKRGRIDLTAGTITAIDFLPSPPSDAPSHQLHGTVHTKQGDFTGFLQWDREEALGSDRFKGAGPDGDIEVPFDAIASMLRTAADPDVYRLTLRDGKEMTLARQSSPTNRGVYIDDARYGRVLVSWDAFQDVEFTPGGNGPTYDDYPRGGPITGTLTTRDGRRLTGRLVYDLDESEVTDTLDASAKGVTYTIPFGSIASIALGSSAQVNLRSGEQLQFDLNGDLAKENAGVLILADKQPAQYVKWAEVTRIDLSP